MWKKSFLFHEKRAQLNIIQNLFILVIGIICVYYGFSLSEGLVTPLKAISLSILLLLGFDLSFMTLLIIINNKFTGTINFNKLYFGLGGIVIPSILIGTGIVLENFGIISTRINEQIMVINVIIMLFGSPLWIIFIILGIIEYSRNKESSGNVESKQIPNSKKDLKIASFLLSLVVGLMIFGFLTGGGGEMVLPTMIGSNMQAFVISLVVMFLSYYLIYRKLIEIEKSKPGFISKIFFNKSFDGDVNYDVGYETYNKIGRGIKSDYDNYKTGRESEKNYTEKGGKKIYRI